MLYHVVDFFSDPFHHGDLTTDFYQKMPTVMTDIFIKNEKD